MPSVFLFDKILSVSFCGNDFLSEYEDVAGFWGVAYL